MKKPSNPFITTGYRSQSYFCDREDETKTLLRDITNGQPVTLIAIRRIGKTGLIHHVLAKLPKEYEGVYVDILPTESLSDFLNVLTSSILNSVPQRSSPGKIFLEFIKSLRPVISYDPLTGHPQVSIDVRENESEKHIDAVFRFLEKYPKKVVIAIDEFQQILEYPRKKTDAWLRSIMQRLQNVIFIYSGSRQHLMNGLFADPSRPFFRSTSILNLDKIEVSSYSSFIIKHFNKAGKKISEDVTREILEWTDIHTYYVQSICNKIYSLDEKIIYTKTWKNEASRLLKEQETIFFKYRDLLSKHQWELLKAIALEGEVMAPTSKDFIAKHSLGSPATALRSLQSLQKKEMIYTDRTIENKRCFKVYDVFFRRWMETQ